MALWRSTNVIKIITTVLLLLLQIYLKSNRVAADWIALEHYVDESLKAAECSSVDSLNAVVGQHQISQRCQTSKCRRRQPGDAVIPQINPCQPAKSAERALLNVDYGVAGEIQVDQRVESTETTDVDAGKPVVAEIKDL